MIAPVVAPVVVPVTAPVAAPVAAPTPAPAAARPAVLSQQAKKKLSYNEQREYDGMEAAIAAAEKAHTDLDAKLNDPRLVSDHAAYAKACDAAGAAQAEIARLYARWETLEAKIRGDNPA
jgi:ATP-binding cassette subfamily F protein uup